MLTNKLNLKLRKFLSLNFLSIPKLYLISLILLSILFGLLFLIFVEASIIEKEYILLDVNYENGRFLLINKSLEKGNFPVIKHDFDKKYELRLISDKGEILYINSFDPTILYTDILVGDSLTGGVINLDKGEFYIAVPSNKNGDKIEILDDGEKILEEEIYNVGAKYCRIK